MINVEKKSIQREIITLFLDFRLISNLITISLGMFVENDKIGCLNIYIA